MPPPLKSITVEGFSPFVAGGIFKIKAKQDQNFRRANDPKAGGEKQLMPPAGRKRGVAQPWDKRAEEGDEEMDDGRDLYLGLRTKAPGEYLGR